MSNVSTDDERELEAMRLRNGPVILDFRELEHALLFKRYSEQEGISLEEVKRRIEKHTIQTTPEYGQLYRETLSLWCGDCRGYHRPTDEHPLCKLCTASVHQPAPPDLHFDYKGWRFTAPFICMCCGNEICFRQWARSRTCGPCDGSRSSTRRLIGRKCFAGPHEKLPTHGQNNYDIEEDEFVDPAAKDKHPRIGKKPKYTRLYTNLKG